MPELIKLDGSYLEGGGQILRTATALSVVTGSPCRIFNIRRGRKNPGLRIQHRAGLKALAEFSGGKLQGGEVGSTEITFRPGTSRRKRLDVEISTAGSITLVMQSLTLPALLSEKPVEIHFKGGATDTHFAPSMDYFTQTFLRTLEKMGARMEVKIEKRGYYPKGGAVAIFATLPSRLNPVELTKREELKKISVISRATKSLRERRVAERQAQAASELLAGNGVKTEESVKYHDALGMGSSVCLVAEYENSVLGADGLGERGVRAEDVGRKATDKLLTEIRSGACLDSHMADQVLPYMAASGEECSVSVSEVTNHARTNMWVIENFLPGRFEARENLVRWLPRP